MRQLLFLLLLVSLACCSCARGVALPPSFPIANFALPPGSSSVTAEQDGSTGWKVEFTNHGSWNQVDQFLRVKAKKLGLSEEIAMPGLGQQTGPTKFNAPSGWSIMWMQAYPDAASLKSKDKYGLICWKP